MSKTYSETEIQAMFEELENLDFNEPADCERAFIKLRCGTDADVDDVLEKLLDIAANIPTSKRKAVNWYICFESHIAVQFHGLYDVRDVKPLLRGRRLSDYEEKMKAAALAADFDSFKPLRDENYMVASGTTYGIFSIRDYSKTTPDHMMRVLKHRFLR